MPSCPAASLPRCLAASLPRCLAASLPRCPAASLPRCPTAWLPAWLHAWLRGCLAGCIAWLPGCLPARLDARMPFSWLPGWLRVVLAACLPALLLASRAMRLDHQPVCCRLSGHPPYSTFSSRLFLSWAMKRNAPSGSTMPACTAEGLILLNLKCRLLCAWTQVRRAM